MQAVQFFDCAHNYLYGKNPSKQQQAFYLAFPAVESLMQCGSTNFWIPAKISNHMRKNTKRFEAHRTHPSTPRGAEGEKSFKAQTQHARKSHEPGLHWGHVGSWYDDLIGQDGSDHHQKLIIPGVLRMLDIKPGEHLLDVACGQGVLGRAAAKRGVQTTGVDLAGPLIQAALERRENTSLEHYYQADVRDLAGCAAIVPGTFDAAACVLAIANITPLSPVWQGIYTALKPGGKLVVVLLHPCFRIPKQSSWQWDQQNAMQHRLVDAYLTSEKIPIAMHPGQDTGPTTTTFHRPLQAYINTLGSAGLWIDHTEEWISGKMPPQGIRFAALDKSRREIPLFLALRAIKAG